MSAKSNPGDGTHGKGVKGGRTDGGVAIPGRFRIGVGVEGTLRAATRPVPGAADLVGVRLVHDLRPAVRRPARVGRRRAPREPGHGEVEAAPEEVDGADLADESGSEVMEHSVDLDQAAPEPVHGLGVVTGMVDVFSEGGVDARHFHRHRPDPRREAELVAGIIHICLPAEESADVLHLIRRFGASLDWERVLDRFGEYWRVLFSHIVLFGFVYPNQRHQIPTWVVDKLTRRFVAEQPEPKNYVCYGTLLSREQYLYDITDLNYADARIPPVGRMTPHDIEIWQAAIGER